MENVHQILADKVLWRIATDGEGIYGHMVASTRWLRTSASETAGRFPPISATNARDSTSSAASIADECGMTTISEAGHRAASPSIGDGEGEHSGTTGNGEWA